MNTSESASSTISNLPQQRPQRAVIVLQDNAHGSADYTLTLEPDVSLEHEVKSPAVQTARLLERLFLVTRLVEANRYRVIASHIDLEAGPQATADPLPDHRGEVAELYGYAWRTGRKAELEAFIAELHAAGSVPDRDPMHWPAEILREVRSRFQQINQPGSKSHSQTD